MKELVNIGAEGVAREGRVAQLRCVEGSTIGGAYVRIAKDLITSSDGMMANLTLVIRLFDIRRSVLRGLGLILRRKEQRGWQDATRAQL